MTDAASRLTALAETGPPDEAFALAETLAGEPDAAVQSALGQALFTLGRRDPEALSVFLAAHAFTLPRATIAAAGRALPEAD